MHDYHDAHPMERLTHFGREVATTLGVTGGVIAYVNVAGAYDIAMKALQLLLLVVTLAYTVFRAVRARADWLDYRRRKSRAKHRTHESDPDRP